MDNEFSSQEINQLIEALLCWEKEPGNREVQNSMFSMMFAGIGAKTEEESRSAVEKARQKSEREQDKAETEAQLRREASVILQAKLISMRNASLNRETATA